MTHPWQVDKNLKSVDFNLSKNNLAEIDQVIRDAGLGLHILSQDAYMDKTKQK